MRTLRNCLSGYLAILMAAGCQQVPNSESIQAASGNSIVAPWGPIKIGSEVGEVRREAKGNWRESRLSFQSSELQGFLWSDPKSETSVELGVKDGKIRAASVVAKQGRINVDEFARLGQPQIQFEEGSYSFSVWTRPDAIYVRGEKKSPRPSKMSFVCERKYIDILGVPGLDERL